MLNNTPMVIKITIPLRLIPYIIGVLWLTLCGSVSFLWVMVVDPRYKLTWGYDRSQYYEGAFDSVIDLTYWLLTGFSNKNRYDYYVLSIQPPK